MQPPFKCQQFLPSSFFSPRGTFTHSCGLSCCPRLPHVCLQPRSLHGIAEPNIQPPVRQSSAKLTMRNPELSPSPTCFSGILCFSERQHHPPGPQPAASSHPQLFPAPSPPTSSQAHWCSSTPLTSISSSPHCHCLNLGLIISCLENSISLLIGLFCHLPLCPTPGPHNPSCLDF